MMSIKFKRLLRILSLLVLLTSFIPLDHAVLAAPVLPPVDMFQLPWEQGLAWVAIDGFDNASKRLPGSPHNYLNGGAIDFAPHNNMIRGENTANFWVTAAADGKIVELSKCHMKIAHANGWVSEYQHLANLQVKLGDTVARNQRLAIIANALSQPVCPGSEPPDIPHLHFVLRPNMVGATFAGWEFRYSSFWNSTTFRKGGKTVGLYKPLLNVFDVQPTATPGGQATATPGGQTTATPGGQTTATPGGQATATPGGQLTATPGNFPTVTPTAPSGPFVSTTVSVPNISIGETVLATVSLMNVPGEGYTSSEFTCTYNANLVDVSNFAIANLFGADAATVIYVPQTGSVIVAIAGSKGNRAVTSGAAFTFDIKGLDVGQTALECTARISKGDNVLTPLPFVGTSLSVLGILPTPTLTQAPPPMTPTISPTTCNQAELTGYGSIPPGTLINPGTTFTQSWGLRNIGWCTWTTDYRLVFYGGDQMGAPLSVNIASYEVAPGQLIIVSVLFTAPAINDHYTSLWKLSDASGSQFGVGASANDPLMLDINVSDPSATPTGPTPTPFGTPTLPTSDWLTYINPKYGFQFNYPHEGTYGDGMNDNYARINLPIVPGTNLSEKYVEVIVAETSGLCQSPLATQSILATSETVVINGITFLKQTGGDAGAGNIYDWVAYSTLRDNVCVSLDFILHSHNPDLYPTPSPVFDYASEAAVFEQIVVTYAWFTLPTATPGFETPLPVETSTSTPTPAQFPTASASPTAAPISGAIVTGQVIAAKIVTVRLYDSNESLVEAVNTNLDGTFRFDVLAGTYTIVGTANGFLRIQGTITLAGGDVRAMSVIALLAGDIDDNGIIDQFDAMTIGFNYNTVEPPGADLNNDGIINVIDLELLARNYRKTGPVVWQ